MTMEVNPDSLLYQIGVFRSFEISQGRGDCGVSLELVCIRMQSDERKAL